MRSPTCMHLTLGLLAWLGLWLCRPNLWFNGHPGLAVLGIAFLVILGRCSLAAAGVVLFASHAALLTWIVTALWTPVGPPRAIVAWLVVAAFASLFPWLALAVARRCARSGGAYITMLPPAWTLGESLRAELPYGFDWPSLGYAVAGTPPASSLGLLGVHGVSGLLVAVACLLAALLTRSFGPTECRAAVLVVMLFGAASLLPRAFSEHPQMRIALVQTDDYDLTWTEQLPERLLQQIDLVVGPEGLLKDPDIIPFRGATLISGSVCPLHGDCRANRVDHRDGDGRLIGTRNKSVLVPWYEVEFLEGLMKRPPAFNAFHIDDIRIATVICYEIAHTGAIRAALADDPTVLLNPTSDLWQDSDLAARQQTAIAQSRAAELGLPVVRASNRYYSSVFSPTGVGLFAARHDRTIHVTTVIPNAPGTPRGRFPLATEILLVAVCLTLLFMQARNVSSRTAPLS